MSAPANSGVVVHVDHADRQVDADRLQSLAGRVLQEQAEAAGEINVVLTDAATVLELNRTYLDHDYETDVLSFPLNEPGHPVEGEVYVDLDMAASNAGRFQTAFEDEVARYVVHGVLHLCGYDDATSAEREAMRALEDRYLRK